MQILGMRGYVNLQPGLISHIGVHLLLKESKSMHPGGLIRKTAVKQSYMNVMFWCPHAVGFLGCLI